LLRRCWGVQSIARSQLRGQSRRPRQPFGGCDRLLRAHDFRAESPGRPFGNDQQTADVARARLLFDLCWHSSQDRTTALWPSPVPPRRSGQGRKAASDENARRMSKPVAKLRFASANDKPEKPDNLSLRFPAAIALRAGLCTVRVALVIECLHRTTALTGVARLPLLLVVRSLLKWICHTPFQLTRLVLTVR
jgi:hypothetical protein